MSAASVLSSSNTVPYNSGISHHSANDIAAIQSQSQSQSQNEDVSKLTQTFVLNSYNRNIAFETLFRFQVVFNPSITTNERYPIYENNPTLPQTDQQRHDGVKGDINPEYDSSRPYGNIIDFEYIKCVGMDRGCHFDQPLKDVVRIHIRKVIMPRYNFLKYNIPTIIEVNIEEYSGSLNLNNQSKSCVEIMTSEGRDGEEDDFTSVTSTYYPVQGESSILFDTPVNISHFNIALSFPLYFKSQTDTSEVVSIIESPGSDPVTTRQIECSPEFVGNTTVKDIVSFVGIPELDSLRYIVQTVDTTSNTITIDIDGEKDPFSLAPPKIINISLQFILVLEIDKLKRKWNHLG